MSDLILSEPCPYRAQMSVNDLVFDKAVSNWIMLIPLNFKVLAEIQARSSLAYTRVVRLRDDLRTDGGPTVDAPRCEFYSHDKCAYISWVRFHLSWLLADLPDKIYEIRDEILKE